MTDHETWVLVAAVAVAAFFWGLYLGERHARLYIQNVRLWGTPEPLDRAVIFDPMQAPQVGRGPLRLVREDDSPPQFDPTTIENGVEYLLAEARGRGEQLSEEQARDEVIRMLNAEGPEMA